MGKKKKDSLSRRNFITDTGKTIFYGALISTAIPAFIAGCKKDDSCNQLKEGEQGDHFCDDYYVCTDSRGFACPSTGEFQCGDELFSCYVVFTCTPSNNFFCQPSTAYNNPKGGAGG